MGGKRRDSFSTDTSVELRKEKKLRNKQREKQREKDKKQDKKIEETKEKVEKKIHKVENAIHKAENAIEQKVSKKIHKAEDAIEHKVEKKLNKVEDAIENKVFKGIYQKLKYKLRRNGCLYVNGSDAFAFAWAKKAQVIEAGEPIIFECANTILNVDFKSNTGAFHICRDGIYSFEVAVVVDVSGAVAFAINDVVVPSTITNLIPGQQVVLQGILPLKKGVCVKTLNYDLSGGAVLTTAAQPFDAINASFTLQRIAPWTKKFGGCCPLPPLPCYDSESDCSSRSSSRSSRSSRSSKSSKSTRSTSRSSSRSTRSRKPCKKPVKPCKPKSRKSSRSSRSSSRSSRSSGISTASRSSSDYSYGGRCDRKGGRCDNKGRK
jgi:hypothetical protein